MAKNNSLDVTKLLGNKKEIIKNKPADIEAAVKKIHEPQVEKEKTVRTTYDMPASKYWAIKRRMVDLDIKFISRYLDSLVDKDLGM